MTIITIERRAKCKDCVFARSHRDTKKNGELSMRRTWKCTNENSGRTSISYEEFVCDEWQVGPNY